VTTRGAGEIGNFAANPDDREAPLKKSSDHAVQPGNRQQIPGKIELRNRRAPAEGRCARQAIHKTSSDAGIDTALLRRRKE
jgi:hypothetical protein